MITSTMPSPSVMHQAVRQRDKTFEGVFWLGVISTRIFCRPGCPARTPNQENIRFFPNVAECLASGFRACRRCRPLERDGEAPEWLRPLLAEVEKDPSRRWRDSELQTTGFHPVRVRRWFQAQHGMTFHGYLRARRLGAALGKIGEGQNLSNAGFDAGYESVSGFREAFEKMFRLAPGRARDQTAFVVRPLTTPLGMMVAAATESELCFLEFHDRRAFEAQVKTLAQRMGARYSPGDNAVLQQTESELEEYFSGARTEFSVPISMPGSEWERAVWQQLLTIPFGETCAYSDIAKTLQRPKASRAVGTANGRNPLSILVPCHRVIRADGSLSGYGGGIWRKQKLLDHEREVRADS